MTIWRWWQPTTPAQKRVGGHDRNFMGAITLEPDGLGFLPDDAYYHGQLSREEALDLARAIIEQFGEK